MSKTKVVNIYPTMPITKVNPPIRSSVKNVTKSIEEIRTCLMCRAFVEEVTPNGTIRLDNTNYDKDNYVECDHHECTCGGCGESVKEEKTEASIWDDAYNNAIAGVDLASMTRKQRRAAEAAARNAADKAVAESKNEEEATEPVNEVKDETEVETAADETVVETEEPVETMDAEEIFSGSVE